MVIRYIAWDQHDRVVDILEVGKDRRKDGHLLAWIRDWLQARWDAGRRVSREVYFRD